VANALDFHPVNLGLSPADINVSYWWHHEEHLTKTVPLSLSVLMAIFPDKPFIGAKNDGSGGDKWRYKTCKAPVKSLPPTNQRLTFLQAGCPSCCQTNSVIVTLSKH